jgi:transcriptional regulator GlxA family with amidase domain
MQFIETIQTLHNRLHPHQDLLDRIVAAQVWAKKRLDRPISLEEMAAHACISTFYFIRQFRKEKCISD